MKMKFFNTFSGSFRLRMLFEQAFYQKDGNASEHQFPVSISLDISRAAKLCLWILWIEHLFFVTLISKNSFECSINDEADVRIRRWISAAVWFNVKRFNIDLNDEGDMSFELPHCFFTCATVRELYLRMIESIIVPPTICFSSLKILHLYGIEFQDDLSAQRLFSGCPVLEEMYLSEINWVNVTNVSICAPKLQRLMITDIDTLGEVWNESEGRQVMIFGTSLKYFKYSGELVNDYCLYELSSLEKVTIAAHDVGPRSRIAAYRLYKFLMGVSKVKDLVLSHEAVEVLNSAAELPSYMPLFNNLSSLTFYKGPVNLDCKVLLMILEKSPCLEALQFPWVILHDFFGTSLKCFEYLGELVNDYCLCELSSLEKVKISLGDVGLRSRIAAYRFYKLLMGISKVKDLVLSFDAVKVLNSAAELLSYMPLFNNLSSLAFYMGPLNLDCKVLLKILENFPCLEALEFECIVLDQNSDGKQLLDPLPSCFSSHPKKIEIRKYFGNEGQYVDMVEVLLERAVVLDKLVLAWPESRSTEEAKVEIHNQLLVLPRASAACEMIFY